MHIGGLLVWIRGPSGLPLTFGRAATRAIRLAAPGEISLAASGSPSRAWFDQFCDPFGHLQADHFGRLHRDQVGYLHRDHLAHPVTPGRERRPAVPASPIKHVAAFYGLGGNAVKELDKATLSAQLGPPDLDGLEVLAMDELANPQRPSLRDCRRRAAAEAGAVGRQEPRPGLPAGALRAARLDTQRPGSCRRDGHGFVGQPLITRRADDRFADLRGRVSIVV
jgi:hypothetical protein